MYGISSGEVETVVNQVATRLYYQKPNIFLHKLHYYFALQKYEHWKDIICYDFHTIKSVLFYISARILITINIILLNSQIIHEIQRKIKKNQTWLFKVLCINKIENEVINKS